jgi:hypothetical protein
MKEVTEAAAAMLGNGTGILSPECVRGRGYFLENVDFPLLCISQWSAAFAYPREEARHA